MEGGDNSSTAAANTTNVIGNSGTNAITTNTINANTINPKAIKGMSKLLIVLINLNTK